MKYVLIYNPETRGIDTTVLRVERFTVQAVFDAMAARDWWFQSGVYVAIKVEPDDHSRIIHGFDSILTFTVEESERVVRERIAVPA